jgi:hypothetical protein
MVRKFVSLVFAFLLLGLQQELLLHPLTHLPELKARHHSSLKLPAIEIACVECSLLAGATHAVGGSQPPAVFNSVAAVCIAFEPVARHVAAPSYYQSRAPPLYL